MAHKIERHNAPECASRHTINTSINAILCGCNITHSNATNTSKGNNLCRNHNKKPHNVKKMQHAAISSVKQMPAQLTVILC